MPQQCGEGGPLFLGVVRENVTGLPGAPALKKHKESHNNLTKFVVHPRKNVTASSTGHPLLGAVENCQLRTNLCMVSFNVMHVGEQLVCV